MGLEEVKKEILEKADQEARRILEEGKREAAAVLQKAKEKATEEEKVAKEETAKILEGIERQELSMARFEAKKILLDKKKEVLEAAFAEAGEKLKRLDAKSREKYTHALLERAKEAMQVAVVHGREEDKATIQKMKSVQYKKRDILGGIIAENAAGDVSEDYSFEELLREIREKYIEEIARTLFG
ncbi:hypothetical protein HYS48_03260 [Candidatus Woesearchaeota archaeon]|nr:hypothetical protein [Candidatus Woesearchaeota archaeon]